MPAAEAPVDREAVKTLLQEIAQLLESDLTEAMNRLEALKQHLANSSVNEEFKRLEKQVESFDTDSALKSRGNHRRQAGNRAIGREKMVEVGRKPKVLIVDDTPENIQVLMETLKDQYTIVAAINGEKALKMAVAEPRPDLILLDIMMPGMDGYEVCRRLKADEQAQHIPIIFVTAKTEVEDETLGFELGAVDYITKPFSIPVVKARVKAHLELKILRDLEAIQRAKLETVLGMLNSELAEAADYVKFLLPQPITEGPADGGLAFCAINYPWGRRVRVPLAR